MPTNPFLLAIFAKTAETYLPGIPIALQNTGMTIGYAVARPLGYGRVFARYAGSVQETATIEAVAVDAA